MIWLGSVMYICVFCLGGILAGCSSSFYVGFDNRLYRSANDDPRSSEGYSEKTPTTSVQRINSTLKEQDTTNGSAKNALGGNF